MTHGGAARPVEVSRHLLLFSGRTVPALLLLLLLAAHAPATAAPDSVLVVRHSWHPGILIPMPAAEPLLVGNLRDARPRYVEVGWGDRGYYPDPNPGFWTLLRAALWPTPSVIQIVAVNRPVEHFAPEGPIIAVTLPDSLRDDLLAFVLDELTLEDGDPIDVAPSLYGDGRFFAADRRYHVLHNSNQWAARALRLIGCDLSVWQSLTVELLLSQVEACGTVIRDASGESRAAGSH